MKRSHEKSLALGSKERRANGLPDLPASILSLDAATGRKQWELPLPPFG